MCKKRRNKFSLDEREQAALKVIKGGCSNNSVARELQTSPSVVRRWAHTYKLHGKEGLSLKNNIKYTGDFKYQLIKEMLDDKLSLLQMSSKYLITQSLISKWRRDYEQYGASVLYKENPRGRPSKMKEKSKKEVIISPTSNYRKLQDENLRLRAENDFLKKLRALMLKEEAHINNNELKSSKN